MLNRVKTHLEESLSVFEDFILFSIVSFAEKISCLSLTVIQSNDIFSQIEQHYGEEVAVEV
jgi:hypothetical protein